MYDRRAAFEAFFKRVEDGYIFFPHRFARGISVTEAEHDRMVEAYEDLNSGKALVAFIAMIVAIFALSMVGANIFSLGDSPVGAIVLGVVVAGAGLVLLWLRGRAIRKPIRGRKPDQPRRSGKEFDAAIGRANGKFSLLLACMWAAITAVAAMSLYLSPSAMTWAMVVLSALNAGIQFWLYFSGRRAIRDERV